MANKEHVKLIKKRLEEWNGWRRKHPEERPDLSGANLSGANLNVADLSDADLYGAVLREAENLTIEQLSKVKSLYGVKLDAELMEQIKEKYPNLLKEPKPKGKLIKREKIEATGSQIP